MSSQAGNPPVALDDQLCYAIYSAGMAIQRLYKPFLDELGLTYPQYLVLNVLWRNDKQTVGAIAEKLALESSTLTPLLKRLEAAGLVRRARCPEDERQVRVSLTDQGKTLYEEACRHRPTWHTRAFDHPDEMSALRERIVALRDRLRAQEA